jgi:hypothetical protein
VVRWEEPHHPGPWLQLETHANPLDPTLQHTAGRRLEPIRRTELLAAALSARNPFCRAENLDPARSRQGPGKGSFLQLDLQEYHPFSVGLALPPLTIGVSRRKASLK